MAHKLLIETYYQFKKGQFSNLLKPNEFARGTTINITYYLTNIGETAFPGGTLTEVKAVFNEGMGGGLNTWQNPNSTIPQLPPNTRISIFYWSVTMRQEGLVWVKCKIKSNDNQPVEYYQTKIGAPIGGDEWRNVYTVVNREQLQIIQLLKEMNGKLDKFLKNDN